MNKPQIGDFFVVSITGLVGQLIRLGQLLAGGGWSNYQHAGIYIGNGQVVEAEPGGARVANLSEYDGHTIAWSTGLIALTQEQRENLANFAEVEAIMKTPYSALDYFAIAFHRFHIPAPLLRDYIASSKHMICSQLVDWLYSEIGVNLFSDRWNGYVMPADLGNLIYRWNSLRFKAAQTPAALVFT